MSKHDLPIFSLPAHTKVIVSIIKNLAPGMYRIPLERCKDQRSLSQNAYMWGVVLPYVAKGMTDAWGEKIDVNQAKAAMQKQFLTRPICDQKRRSESGIHRRYVRAIDGRVRDVHRSGDPVRGGHAGRRGAAGIAI
jgi:hypothetical protein